MAAAAAAAAPAAEDPPTEDEIKQIKNSFKSADRYNDGWIGKDELAQVFRDLDTGWSDDDLDDIFAIVDKQNTGRIQYNQFVDWLMSDGDPLDVDDDESDDDDADDVAGGQHVTEGKIEIDLEENFKLDAWIRICKRLNIDKDDAEEMYGEVLEEAKREGDDPKDGLPLKFFLDDLQIEQEDRGAMNHLAEVIKAYKAKLAKAEDDDDVTDDVDMAVLHPVVDKVIRWLDFEGRGAEDTWKIIQEGKPSFTKAGRAAVEKLKKEDRKFLEDKVKACMVSPPLLNASAGQAAAKERCIQEVTKIIERCKAKGEKYTDTSWDMMKKPNEVLYVDKQRPGYDCTVGKPAGFKRLTDMFKKKKKSGGGGLFGMLPGNDGGPVVFKGGAKAGDIQQGQIGTCFLLGAMGAMVSNNDQAIKKMFLKFDTEVGVYGMRFNVDGEWEYVIVDDYFPVDEGGNLLYAHSKDANEVWCPLLEKAYCKLHTSFEMCDGGRCNEAIMTFFGGCGGKFMIKRKHTQMPKHYFKVLKQARENGWLMTTAFEARKGNTKKGAGKCGEAMLQGGLVGGHAYSILKVVAAHGHQLVQLRNPWGTGEWTGKWGDTNEYEEWSDIMKEATGYQGLNDGKFWMSIEDFVHNSSGAEYVRTFGPDWKKLTQYGRFQAGKNSATALFKYDGAAADEISFAKNAEIEVVQMDPGWWTGKVKGSDKKGFFPANYVQLNDRPIARFDLEGTPKAGKTQMTVVIMCMQRNVMMQRKFFKRKQDGLNYKDTSYPGLSMTIVAPDGSVVATRKAKKRQLNKDIVLEAGTYRIYCYSSDGKGNRFMLRTYIKDGTATLKEVPGAESSELNAILNG